ncbi:MAG: hypothetical protein AB7E05_14790 [Sphingobium sp.]
MSISGLGTLLLYAIAMAVLLPGWQGLPQQDAAPPPPCGSVGVAIAPVVPIEFSP